MFELKVVVVYMYLVHYLTAPWNIEQDTKCMTSSGLLYSWRVLAIAVYSFRANDVLLARAQSVTRVQLDGSRYACARYFLGSLEPVRDISLLHHDPATPIHAQYSDHVRYVLSADPIVGLIP